MHYMPFTYSLEPKASSFVKSNIGSANGSEEDEEAASPVGEPKAQFTRCVALIKTDQYLVVYRMLQVA